MAIRYTPDTCDCIIEYDPTNVTYTNWVQKCFEHKDLDGQALQDAVFTHNQVYQVTGSESPVELATNRADKQAEKIRIRGLGAVTKNTS